MPDELFADVPAYRWLFTVAAALGVTALVLAIATLRGPRTGDDGDDGNARCGSIALAITAAIALTVAVGATIEDLGFRGFDGFSYLGDLGFGAMYVLGILLGCAIAIGSVLGGRRLQRRWSVAAAVPSVVVAGLTVLLVLGVGELLEPTRASELYRHPPDTLLGNEREADRLAGAQFATDLVVTPAGEVLVAEHLTGRILVLTPSADGRFTSEAFGDVPIPEDGRLLHLALHPEWPQMPYVYASAHEGSGPEQRLSIFRLHATGLRVDSVEPIVRGLPAEDPTRGPEADHHGSALAACGEYLYLSVGDTDSPGPGGLRAGNLRARAQMPGLAEGKVLRYRFEGADLVPAVPSGANPPVFAMGFRNPFAMDCGETPDEVVVADNGFVGRDQVRVVTLSSNHEWPLSNVRDAFTPPIFDSGPDSALAPTGVALRSADGTTDIWVSSFHVSSIYRLLFDETGEHADRVELVHSAGSSILSLTDGPDGCLYFTTSNAVWRLRDGDCAAPEVTASLGAFESAEAFFLANCAACHGLDREGGAGPSLLPDRLRRADDYYADRILNGVPGTKMPAWREAGLNDEQAQALVDYLRSEP